MDLLSTKRLLGIWDTMQHRLSLGGLLIFVAELQMLRFLHQPDCVELWIIDAETRLFPSEHHKGTHSRNPDSRIAGQSPLLQALLGLQGIDSCFLCKSLSEVHHVSAQSINECVFWPSVDPQVPTNYRYASTLFAQQFYREHGFIPYLSCRPAYKESARTFLAKHAMGCIPVTVHLKRSPNGHHCSNANVDAWSSFFETCQESYPEVRFVLIGNEETDPRIRRSRNIIVTRDFGINIGTDLALIQMAVAFMGMSSGPCQMALFSRVPYVIYKNPDHDAEEMDTELSGSAHFPFAAPLQKFKRMFETNDILLKDFRDIYLHAEPGPLKEAQTPNLRTQGI